ncbi:MAG: hypothetical protein HQL37_14530 [Alphaproteobacteria bacterium]|nr:hypothetical protein [Alphaproteobacteria bacterium]
MKISIQGDLRQILEQKIQDMARAATDAVAEVGQRLKEDLRGQVVRAGLGTRLANTWQMKFYPSGGQPSLGAAAYLYSKAPLLINAFNEGVVITGKDGLWLAIPTSACPKRVGGKRVTPAGLETAWGIRLRFIFRRGRPSLLVAEMRSSRSRDGVLRRPSQRAIQNNVGMTTAPLFILVPQVKLKKRLDIEGARASAPEMLAMALLKHTSSFGK